MNLLSDNLQASFRNPKQPKKRLEPSSRVSSDPQSSKRSRSMDIELFHHSFALVNNQNPIPTVLEIHVKKPTPKSTDLVAPADSDEQFSQLLSELDLTIGLLLDRNSPDIAEPMSD